jgi:hypothetical protein
MVEFSKIAFIYRSFHNYKAMRELAPGYSCEVDSLDEYQWDQALQLFDDANVYQTWAYEAVRNGEKKMSHFVLKRKGQIVAIAQSRLVTIPFIKTGIAYIRWGPVWNLSGKNRDMEVFQQAIRGLRNEYVLNRGLVLRIYPCLFEEESNVFIPILIDEEYKVPAAKTAGRTMLMDVSTPMETLRKGLGSTWRKNLNSAEKKRLSIVEGYEDDLFVLLIQIYDEMVDIKKFERPNDINEFREIQQRLPPELKMRILLSFSDGKPAAGALSSTIGNCGMCIYRATNSVGRETKASYLLQWRIIEWVKEQNCVCYDLNGINPEQNPGTYRFKLGLCGNNGKDVYYLGVFHSSKSALFISLINWAERMRTILRRIKDKSTKMILR